MKWKTDDWAPYKLAALTVKWCSRDGLASVLQAAGEQNEMLNFARSKIREKRLEAETRSEGKEIPGNETHFGVGLSTWYSVLKKTDMLHFSQTGICFFKKGIWIELCFIDMYTALLPSTE